MKGITVATSIEQAVTERMEPTGLQPAVRADTILRKPPAPAPVGAGQPPAANDDARPGTDPMDFVRANRIHVEHGSLFIDPYLVIHPRELDPKNEAQLRAKMQLTYSINNPSFYEAPERVAIALNLGQLVPVSLGAKRSKLMDEVHKFNSEVDSGADAQLQQQAADKRAPFTAIVRDTVENPQVDPVGMEVLKNGLSIYLLMREKLTQNHFLKPLSDYVERSSTPDQVLHDLSYKTGISPRDVREAALQGGLEGVGKLLGIDPKYVADVKKLADYAAQNDFGYNIVEHWHLGRQLRGIDASLQEKLQTGMEARITAKISEYRGRVRHYYDVPEPIKAEEERIARVDLMYGEPIQRQAMFALGYEICHTPENTADAIAFHKGVYGLHRKAANDLNDIRGTYRIYYGGHGSLKGSIGTERHEEAHLFFPKYFTQADIAHVDQLSNADAARFESLQKLLDTDFDAFESLHKAYKAGTAQEQQAVIEAANERFAKFGITVDALFPNLTDAKSFRFLVADANDVLSVEGGRYNRSGYDTPQERFREVISRFAEMRQVSYRNEPDVLRFVAPGLTEVWETHYIPHLERVYQDAVAMKAQGADFDTINRAVRGETARDVAEAPKVDERVTPTPSHEGAPVATAAPGPQADSSDAPRNQVLANSVALNSTTLAGLDALQSMHISH